MSNPPDNKNPGSNIPPVPGSGSTTPGSSTRKTDTSRPQTSTSAPATSGNATPPPVPKTPVPKNPAPRSPVPGTQTTATPAPGTPGSNTSAVKPGTPPVPGAQPSTARRATDSIATSTTTNSSTTAGKSVAASSPATPPKTTLERPRPTGTPEPGPRRANQRTRPARPLEREPGRRPEGPPRTADRRPPADGRPGRRPPENRPVRSKSRKDQGRPVYRDNRPRRRMAPPPGAKNGRFVAPAARPARRGHVIPPAAAAPAGSAWGPLLFGILLLAGVLWYAIKHYTPMIKSDLTARTNSALETAGFGDAANVEIDGRTAILSGNVATDSDSERAEEVVASTNGVRNVDNQLKIGGSDTDAAQDERTAPSLSFTAGDDGVQLSGTVSDQDYADQIENHAKEVYGEDRVSGSITVDPNSTNPGWWPAVQQLIPDLNAVNGSFAVADGTLRLTGEAADEQVKNEIGTKAEELLAGQLTVDNGITVATTEAAPEAEPEPAPVALQPASANFYNTGKIIQLNGSMPAESAETLTNALANADLPVSNRITVSDDIEAPAWADSFGDAVAALDGIQQAEIDIQPDGDVAIYGVAESDDAKQTAADKVASVFADQNVNNQISVRAPEPEPVAPSMQPFASVSDNGTTLTIAGLLPPAAADAISSAFEGTGRTVVSNVTADDRVMQPEWTDALASTVQAMDGIENSKVIVAASGELTISGLADSDAARQQAADASFNAFGNSVSLLNDITVKGPDITELLASIDLAAIRFRSGSAELDADSIGILEQVADALTQVPDANVAISGHTDSTGSAEINLALSGQRAEQVRNFLIERGINGDRMTAQGFGSSQPIASNGTVTGRALNRRIDIALIN